MSNRYFVATSQGVLALQGNGGAWQEEQGALLGHRFTCVAAMPGEQVVLAGATGGLYRSPSAGKTWYEANEGLTERHLRWLAFHPDDPDLAFAGTEPAALYRSRDGGVSWEECPEVARLRDQHHWNLPYSPRAGCVRGFAFHGDRGYAAVEQGGLLRSDDRGRSWQMAPGSSGDVGPGAHPKGQVHPDVHAVVVHPSSPDQVFAATGRGLFYSIDGGAYWQLLRLCYCRDVWVDPGQPAHIILGVADGVDRNGRIEESIDGGSDWRPVMEGLDGPWSHHMVERFLAVDDQLLAVLSNGELLAASLESLRWRPILPAVQGVAAVAA